jgi:hypothetical protein
MREWNANGRLAEVPKYQRATSWTGGMPQAIEHWLCKHEALSSNPSPTKKKKKKGNI